MDEFDAAIQAFSDEMERQRELRGWPLHPKAPVSEWHDDEKGAVVACLLAAMRNMPSHPTRKRR